MILSVLVAILEEIRVANDVCITSNDQEVI